MFCTERDRFVSAYEFAFEMLKTAETQQQGQRLSRTYSNAVMPRQVDPALQIGGPGKDGMTAEIYDKRVEQAYRQILKNSRMVSPRDENMYNTLLWQARTSVYGQEQ